MENLTLFGEPIQEKKSRLEKFNDYEGFVDKFKPKKTTDDCYTPPKVYEVVRQWVNDNIVPLDGVEIVRPFYPGGDYRSFDYPAGCIVLDNPPFSILSAICKFYQERGIRYFLFAPTLTAGSARLTQNHTVIITGATIIYDNGAKVATSFVTNISKEYGIIVSGNLTSQLNSLHVLKNRKKYNVPHCAVTAARLSSLAKKGIDFNIPKESCKWISRLKNFDLYGHGWLISQQVASELYRRAEANVNTVALSAEEQRIIENLK